MLKWRRVVASTAAVLAAGAAFGVVPASAKRDVPEQQTVTWEWSGGTKTAAGVSADGPKSSNAYTLEPGAFVYARGYWDVPLTSYQAGFSYKNATSGEIEDGDGSPRISIMLSSSNGGSPVETGEVIYLDPYWCPSPYNSSGWATTNFFRTGRSCTIHTSYGVFTGDDATLTTAATSAWGKAIAAADGDLASWGFLISDQPGKVAVDRVRFGDTVISSFVADAFPNDTDHDGIEDRSDNCPVANHDQADADNDGSGDVCDGTFDVSGSYAGSNTPQPFGYSGPDNFTGTITGNTPGTYSGIVTDDGNGVDGDGCYLLAGNVSLELDGYTSTVAASVAAGSKVCPSGNPDEWNLTLSLTASEGTLTMTGVQSPISGGVRTSTGSISGSLS